MLELTIIGNLGKDAEQKEINGRNYIAFNVACTDKRSDGTEETTWVSCLKPAYNGGNNIISFLTKGTKVFVRGKAYTRTYINQQNVAVATLNCNVYTLELLGSRVATANYGTPNPAPTPQTQDPYHPYGGRPAYPPTPTTGQQTSVSPNDQPPY